MTARITFRSEIFIEGKNLKEIRDKFETLPFYDIDFNDDKVYDYGYCEYISVENADSYKDIMNEYWKAYDS
jgi:hypothetical protein